MSIKECVRCSAATKLGNQCKINTCKYSEFCWQHTKQLFDLGIKPSAIPNAGSGLFTYKEIPANKTICMYKGDILTRETYNANNSGYGVSISNGRVIDAKSTQSCLGRYANNCRPVDKTAGICNGNNAKFSIYQRAGRTTIRIKSTKRIPANSEVYVSYGAGFWRGN